MVLPSLRGVRWILRGMPTLIDIVGFTLGGSELIMEEVGFLDHNSDEWHPNPLLISF